MMLDIFLRIQTVFVIGEPLCDVGTPFWALITLLRNFLEKMLFANVTAAGPLTEENVIFWGWFWVFLANSGHFCGRGAIL